MHRNKGGKTMQSDDGIGDTLVSVLEFPGNACQRQPMTLTRWLHRRDFHGYASGSSLARMIGRYSETVGWMCMARWMTVYGAFAYIASSRT
jgi:hypothetical protein